jgi:hypothetical protein
MEVDQLPCDDAGAARVDLDSSSMRPSAGAAGPVRLAVSRRRPGRMPDVGEYRKRQAGCLEV